MFNYDGIQFYPQDWQRLLTLTRLSVDVAVTGRSASDFTPFTPAQMLTEMQRWGADI
ncbi:MAG TPA: hypothetical protein VMG98_07860 [Verrucomicrobiae bacterium]|nr:hypothetical protein [Verrucomicrobiae bacterium]